MYQIIKETDNCGTGIREQSCREVLEWLSKTIEENITRFTAHKTLPVDKIWGIMGWPDLVFIKSSVLAKLFSSKNINLRMVAAYAKREGYLITDKDDAGHISRVKRLPGDIPRRCYCFRIRKV